jgi:putative transposase
MAGYIRAFAPGGTFFFTVVTYRRRPIFRAVRAREILRAAITAACQRRPFEVDAIVLLPDHLHCIWTLPAGDHDFSTRWRKIKEDFTRRYSAERGLETHVTAGQRAKGLRGVWQQRFWEHTIRDELDFERHVDYIHYNPVKHGHVTCPHLWSWSSFAQWVAREVYDRAWCCECVAQPGRVPCFDDLAGTAIE